MSDTRLLEFAFGVVVAQVFRGEIPKVQLALIGCAAAMVWGLDNAKILAAGALFSLTVLLAARLGTPSNAAAGRFMSLAGEISYSVYLVQVFTIPTICKLISIWWQTATLDIVIVISTLVTVVAGYVSYLFIERPMAMSLRGSPLQPIRECGVAT